MSLSKFKCGYCRRIVWFDEDGKLSHPCLANHTNLIMDKDRNLFINDSLETHVKSENNSNNAGETGDSDVGLSLMMGIRSSSTLRLSLVDVEGINAVAL
ncbi:uncharacterized protein LOC143899742 isoform X3 [Temnothorax americanus]|uniref:uncharacterized protein LOC143899742 isoform X3 n=1 Tax=Temnothorax americanus TaxID=1964332 RepID=UPI004068260B